MPYVKSSMKDIRRHMSARNSLIDERPLETNWEQRVSNDPSWSIEIDVLFALRANARCEGEEPSVIERVTDGSRITVAGEFDLEARRHCRVGRAHFRTAERTRDRHSAG